MDFNVIVKAAGIFTSSSLEVRQCPDQCVGRLDVIEAGGEFPMRQPALARPIGPAVILVLESPHIKEFIGQLGPAKGLTGRNIAKYIRRVPGLETVGNLPLILVNAVQYQCSLGQGTGKYRDKVFLTAWAKGGREDFAQRMRAIYRKGDTLVCACTKGKLPKRFELRSLVLTALVQDFPFSNVLRRTHPVMWNIQLNREYEWRTVAPQAHQVLNH